MTLLGGVLALVIGALMLCSPDVIYSITEEWKNECSGAPSDKYIFYTRISGIVFLAIGIFCVAAFFM